MKKSLIVICGTTASGKSNLAVELASILNTDIISADSRQVYQEFNIGTAKPDKNTLSKINHLLIDICAPTDVLTLAQYQKYAQQIIDHGKKYPLLLVGGTGLYIKSITKGLKIPQVSPQNNLRKQLKNLGQLQIYRFLQQIDPHAASKIHANDELRTLRALEVFYVTGQKISHQQGETLPDYPILQIGLEFTTEDLLKRVQTRTEEMIALGLVQEVEKLIEKYGYDLPLLETLGYAEIKKYLIGEISLESAKQEIILHTMQFAKRQKTWFKADKDIKWYDGNSLNLIDEILAEIESFRNLSA